MAAKHTVTYQNFNESNLILTPITEKSFKAGGISYGNIRYKYKYNCKWNDRTNR